jgi:hypothetical protein
MKTVTKLLIFDLKKIILLLDFAFASSLRWYFVGRKQQQPPHRLKSWLVRDPLFSIGTSARSNYWLVYVLYVTVSSYLRALRSLVVT